MSPLTGALMYQSGPLIQKLLALQPIKDHPEAVKQPFLYETVRHPLEADRRYSYAGYQTPAKCHQGPSIIQLVMESGADTAVTNDMDGNTAWSTLLSDMLQRRQIIWKYCCLFKILSPGVNIHRRNNQGESVISYLWQLLAPGAGEDHGKKEGVIENGLEHLNRHFETVPGEDGGETIVWKETPCTGQAG